MTDGTIHLAMTQSEPGGVREIWNDLAIGLEARGHRTKRFVLFPNRGADQRDAAIAEGWHHIVPERPRGAIAALRMFFKLVAHLRATRPEVILTGMPSGDILIPLAVRVAGLPTRVYVSHHSPAGTHNPKLVRIDTWTGQLKCVKAIVSVSQAVNASLEAKPARYRAKRLVIRNALSERVEQMIDRLRDGASAKVPGRIVALGRLNYQKNYPMLIRAMVHVPNGTLDIVGTGEDEAALRALVHELGLEDRVRFTGHCTREVALAHAATAEVFVQVSLYEGHSLALIEAARLGLPLIVSDVPEQVEGVTDLDGERCGLVVPLGNDQALAKALCGLLQSEEERKSWGDRARRLGLGASNRAMVDAYETLLVR